MSYYLPYDNNTFQLFLKIAIALDNNIRCLKDTSDFFSTDILPQGTSSPISTEYRKAKGCLIYNATSLCPIIPDYFGIVNFIFVYSNFGDFVSAPCAYFDDPNAKLDDSMKKLDFNTYFYLTYCDYDPKMPFQFVNENSSLLTATIVHELTHSYDNFLALKDGMDASETHNKIEETKNDIYQIHRQTISSSVFDKKIKKIILNYLEALYYSMKTEKNAYIAEYTAACVLCSLGRSNKIALENISSKIEKILDEIKNIDIKSNAKSIKERFDQMSYESVFCNSYKKTTEEDIVNDITTILISDLEEIINAFKSIKAQYKI